MNGFQIGSKRLKVQHKRVNHGNNQNGPMGNDHQDNQFQQPPRNMMMHNLSNIPANPMMNKISHELAPPPSLPTYNTTARFDYGGPATMPPPQFHVVPSIANRPPPYQQHNLEMESFSLQEYMPSNNVKHL